MPILLTGEDRGGERADDRSVEQRHGDGVEIDGHLVVDIGGDADYERQEERQHQVDDDAPDKRSCFHG